MILKVLVLTNSALMLYCMWGLLCLGFKRISNGIGVRLSVWIIISCFTLLMRTAETQTRCSSDTSFGCQCYKDQFKNVECSFSCFRVACCFVLMFWILMKLFIINYYRFEILNILFKIDAYKLTSEGKIMQIESTFRANI